MCHFENIRLENAPPYLKSTVYGRFLDDAFLLFRSKDHVEKFKNYLNKQQKNIKFTSQIEENGSLSFLNIIISENNKFVTSVYQEPTFSGVFTYCESFIPDMGKRGLIETLLHRNSRLSSNCGNFRPEIETFNSIFKHNNYPQNFMNHCVNKFLNKLFIRNDLNFMVPKRQLTFGSPYLANTSLD